MLLNPMRAESNELNVATIFVEKIPEKDERLSSYRHLIEKIDSSFTGHLRLFTRIEVIGLSQAELEVEHFQLFSTVGFDQVRNPLLLLKAQRIICITKEEWRETIETTDQLSFLRIKYPYRDFDIRMTDFILFYKDISNHAADEFLREVELQNLGYNIPLSNSLDECAAEITALPTDKEMINSLISKQVKREICGEQNRIILQAFQENYYQGNQKDDYSIVLLGQSIKKRHLGQQVFDSIQYHIKQENWNNPYFLFSLQEDSIGQIIGAVQNEIMLNLQVFPESLLKAYQHDILVRPIENYALLFLSKQDLRNLFITFKSSDIHYRVIGQVKRQINHHLKVGSFRITKEKSDKKLLDNLTLVEQRTDKRASLEKSFCIHLNSVLAKRNMDKKYRVGVLAYDANVSVRHIGLDTSFKQLEIIPLPFLLANKEKFENSIESIAKKIRIIDLLLIPNSCIPSEKCVPEHKILSAVLEHSTMKQSIEKFIRKNGKIIGLGVGNKALVECGLLPYGRYRVWGDEQGYYYPIKQNDTIVEKFDLPAALWNLYLEKHLILFCDDCEDELSVLVQESTNRSVLGILNLRDAEIHEKNMLQIMNDFVCADITKK